MPDIKFVTTDVSAMKLGTTNINKVMQGTTEIWPGGLVLPITTGLQLWLDAEDASTFTYSTGTDISQWRDKSGNNRHMVGPVSLRQPHRATAPSGMHTVIFTKSSQQDYMDSAAFTLAQPFTVFLAMFMGTSVSQAPLSSIGGNFQIYIDVAVLYLFAGSNLAGPSGPGVTGSHAWTFTVNGASSSIHKNSMSAGTGNVGTTGTTTGFRIAERNLASTFYFGGEMFEVIIYNRAVSDTERLAIEAYLRAKWSLPPLAPIPTTGLQLWLDAADPLAFNYESGKVAQWNDKSVWGRHFGMSTVANQPGTGTQNGCTTVVFDGISDRLQTTAWAMTKPITIFVVARNTATAAGQRHVFRLGTDGRIYRDPTTGAINMYQGAVLASSTVWGTTFHQVTAVFNGASSKLGVDGGADVTGDAGPTLFSAGPVSAFGSDNNGTLFWQGDIAEIIIYQREVSGTERTDIQTYLRTKWATP